MDKDPNPLAREIELLLKKTSEANTIIASETATFIYRLAHGQIEPSEVASIQQKVLVDSINSFIKLNIQYTSNLIDASVEISKCLNQNFPPAENGDYIENKSSDDATTAKQGLAFEVETSAHAGEIATTAFLLNSDKHQLVKCTILHSPFVNDAGETLTDVDVLFSPQSFELDYGKAQKIDVSITVPPSAQTGHYRSHVTVSGFEHTHFDILLSVMLPVKEDHTPLTDSLKPLKKRLVKQKALQKKTRKPKL